MYSNKIPVVKLDPHTYEAIEVYHSISEAANSVGVYESAIRRVLKGSGKSKGFYWDYAKEEEINEGNSSNTHQR